MACYTELVKCRSSDLLRLYLTLSVFVCTLQFIKLINDYRYTS